MNDPSVTEGMTIEDARRVARLTRMLLMLAYSGPVPGIVLKGTAAQLAELWPAFDWEVRGQELTPFARGAYSAPMSAEASAPDYPRSRPIITLADAVAGLDGQIRDDHRSSRVYGSAWLQEPAIAERVRYSGGDGGWLEYRAGDRWERVSGNPFSADDVVAAYQQSVLAELAPTTPPTTPAIVPAIVFPVGSDAWRCDADGWWRRPLHIEGTAIRIWQPVAPMNVPDEVITEYLRLIGSISDDVSADVSSNAE